jgi:hypothetical protein
MPKNDNLSIDFCKLKTCIIEHVCTCIFFFWLVCHCVHIFLLPTPLFNFIFTLLTISRLLQFYQKNKFKTSNFFLQYKISYFNSCRINILSKKGDIDGSVNVRYEIDLSDKKVRYLFLSMTKTLEKKIFSDKK